MPMSPTILPVRSTTETATGSAVAASRVLIVDDQKEVAEFLAQMLQLIGYEVSTESNPLTALERLENENFDLVISDFKMPELGGFEFYQAVISLRPSLGARFVFLTGDVFNFETESLLRSAGVPVIEKPFSMATVEETLSQVLSRGATASAIC
ncbi:MAG TPA: response regulator [Verrucomicrobiae bacterium]